MRVTLYQIPPRRYRHRHHAHSSPRWLLPFFAGVVAITAGTLSPQMRGWSALLTSAGGRMRSEVRAVSGTSPAKAPGAVTAPGVAPSPVAQATPTAWATLPPASADFDRLAADLPNLLQPYGARSAVWFKDLTSGYQIVIKGDQQFHPASTIKLPLVVTLIEGAQAGRWSLDDPWPIDKADWEEGSGSLQTVPAGTVFTLRELARRAIEESDNIAANALFRRVGYQAVRDSMGDAGARLASGTLQSLSVADMGPVLVRLAQRSTADPRTWQPLMDWLSHTSRNDWLPAGLPAGFTAYHKWGGLEGYDHDVAVVQSTNARYVLAVYTYRTRNDADLITAVSARVAQTYTKPAIPGE